MAMKKSMPARLPKNETTQFISRSMTVHRRCRKAVDMNCEMSELPRKPGKGECYHNVAGEEIRTAEYNHDESYGEETSADSPNETRSILLVPGCRLSRQCDCATVIAVSQMAG